MTDTKLHSYGLGLATKNSNDDIIEVFYPHLALAPDAATSERLRQLLSLGDGDCGFSELTKDSLQQLQSQLAGQQPALSSIFAALSSGSQPVVLCVLGSDQPPGSIPEAFLKLHLLSHRLVRPHGVNLDGMFGVLKNLAWTNQGPVDPKDLPARQLAARAEGDVLDVMSMDKFPKMTNYVVPDGVRIADTARVRLGAYLGEGTTVMHEGFVNFNAGTLGAAMIEGRISAGVVVGENSDLGGGCSTMGTLSGGGKEIISVGRNCLIGANAGIGIPLADGCIVEAGLYVTAGTKIRLLDKDGTEIRIARARELTTLENHLYRRNSLSGAVECVPLATAVSLNEELHAHN